MIMTDNHYVPGETLHHLVGMAFCSRNCLYTYSSVPGSGTFPLQMTAHTLCARLTLSRKEGYLCCPLFVWAIREAGFLFDWSRFPLRAFMLLCCRAGREHISLEKSRYMFSFWMALHCMNFSYKDWASLILRAWNQKHFGYRVFPYFGIPAYNAMNCFGDGAQVYIHFCFVGTLFTSSENNGIQCS